MAVPQCSSISSVFDANLLKQVENGISKKDPSKTRRSVLPSLQIKPCGERHRSWKNFSSQHGNIDVHVSRSSLFRVYSTFGILFDTEAWLP